MDTFLAKRNKSFVIGCAVGAFMTVSAYIGHQIYSQNRRDKYDERYREISKTSYSDDKELNKMLHVCATMIDVNENGFLSTIDDKVSTADHQSPCCRMMVIKSKWKPPATLPYIYLASNNESRKYEQIKANNHVVLTFADDAGHGYVSLYGQLIEVTNEQKLAELFPPRWSAYPDGSDDPRFCMFKLNVARIEFVSHRFGYDSARNDWRPFILKRAESTMQFETAKWVLADKAKKWRMDYSGYMVFDDQVK